VRKLDEFVTQGAGRGFDGLRLFAAFGVLLSHSFPLTGAKEPLEVATRGQWSIGAVSVAIFFIISGFLITQSADRTPDPRRFVTKRALRIMPALLVTVFVTVFLIGSAFTESGLNTYFHSIATWRYLGLAFFLPDNGLLPGVFIQNPLPGAVNGSLWTLRYEVVCYAAVACLAYLFKVRSALPYILIAVVGLGFESMRTVPVVSMLHVLNFFVLGSIFYWLRDHIPVAVIPSIAALGIALIAMPFHVLRPVTAIAMSYAIIGFGYLASTFKILHHRDYSYGLYLWAFPVQQMWIHVHPMPWWADALASLPLVIALSMLSWHFVEKPAKAFKISPTAHPAPVPKEESLQTLSCLVRQETTPTCRAPNPGLARCRLTEQQSQAERRRPRNR
jgi:peptidoglycan/LPS O-acetylase OafA/YrhL